MPDPCPDCTEHSAWGCTAHAPKHMEASLDTQRLDYLLHLIETDQIYVRREDGMVISYADSPDWARGWWVTGKDEVARHIESGRAAIDEAMKEAL